MSGAASTDMRRSSRRPVAFFMLAALVLAAAMLLATAGCGTSGISRAQYDQLQKGMTLDEVEGLLGQPNRTHRTGSPQNPDVIWYYNKSEGEGLVRISFISGKMDVASPYDVSVNFDE